MKVPSFYSVLNLYHFTTLQSAGHIFGTIVFDNSSTAQKT